MLGVLFDQSLAMIYLSLCNIVNVVRAVIGRCPWSIREHTQMTSRETCCLCLFNMACGFENICQLNSDSASEYLKKSSAGAVYKLERKNKSERNVFLATWKCLNCNKSSKQLSFGHELATVLKLFTRQLSSEQVRALEKGGQAVYRRKKHKKQPQTRSKIGDSEIV